MTRQDFVKIQRTLDVAMERPYGLDIKLNLTIHKLDSAAKKETLSKFKDNITALDVHIYNDDLQRQPVKINFPLELESITIEFDNNCLANKSKELVENVLENNANSLTHIGLSRYLCDTILKLPVLNNIKSLDLYNMDADAALALIKSCKETLIELEINDLNVADTNSFHLPNLKILHIINMDGDAVLALIKACKETLTELKTANTDNLNVAVINSFHFPNIKILYLRWIDGDVALALIKSCKETLTELEVREVNDLDVDVINSFKLPNLKILYLFWMNQDAALALIKSCKEMITELKLGVGDAFNYLNVADINSFQLPNLKLLHLFSINGDAALALIKSCKETLTELKIIEMDDINVAVINSFQLPNLKILHLVNIDVDAALTLIKSFKDSITRLEVKYIEDLSEDDINNIKLPKLEILQFVEYDYHDDFDYSEYSEYYKKVFYK